MVVQSLQMREISCQSLAFGTKVPFSAYPNVHIVRGSLAYSMKNARKASHN